jgi:hypothetical protein
MAQTLRRVFPDGDYPQRLNDLWAAIEAAEKAERDDAAPALLEGEESPFDTLVAQYAALKAEAEADAAEKRRVVVLRAVGRGKWRDLKQRHPARPKSDAVDDKTAEGDRLAGVNTDTIGDDLLYASVQEPMFSSRGDFDDWLDEVLSEGEFSILERDAWSLVNGAQFDPKPPPSSPTRSNGTS